jgi:hypothetical protein
MYGFFDKHGKKLLALASVLLIVVFLLPPTVGQNHGGGGVAVGTVNGESIDPADVQNAADGLRNLNTVFVTVPDRQTGQSGFVPAPQAFLGDFARQLEQEPVAYYLLVREARKAGATPPETRVSEILRPASPTTRYIDGTAQKEYTAIPPARLDAHTVALTDLLAVRENFLRSQRAVKISQPMIDRAVAQRGQQVKLHAALFDAAEYEAQVAAPADDAPSSRPTRRSPPAPATRRTRSASATACPTASACSTSTSPTPNSAGRSSRASRPTRGKKRPASTTSATPASSPPAAAT